MSCKGERRRGRTERATRVRKKTQAMCNHVGSRTESDRRSAPPGPNWTSSLPGTAREVSKCKPATNLLGLDSGLAAVSSVVVAEGSVVDRITVVVSHEWLEEEGRVS